MDVVLLARDLVTLVNVLLPTVESGNHVWIAAISGVVAAVSVLIGSGAAAFLGVLRTRDKASMPSISLPGLYSM